MGTKRTAKLAIGLTLMAALLFLPAGPGVVASPVYVVAAPVRPTNASAVHSTAGVFIDYGLIADPVTHIVAERLTIWDAVAGQDRVFSVGPAATLDGLRISCRNAHHMCERLPKKLEAGKTWLSLVYWDAPKPANDLRVRDTYPGTDEIHTMATPPAEL